MFRAGIVDQDEAVEAVESFFRVAAGPGSAMGPCAERRDLGVSLSELRHRVRLLACRRDLELVESLRRRDREERRVDHRHAPFLTVRRRDHKPQASYALLDVIGVRVWRAEIEASDHGKLALREDLSPRQFRSGAVRLEHAGEADSFGVVAPVAKGRA